MAVEPDQKQFEEIAALANDPESGPLVMLNLNRYRDRDAYVRYGEAALRVLERVGGKVLWHAQAQDVVIGDENDGYDDVIAVWYPSAAAFLALATDPEILERRADRAAGLERATILRCDAASEPVLSSP